MMPHYIEKMQKNQMELLQDFSSVVGLWSRTFKNSDWKSKWPQLIHYWIVEVEKINYFAASFWNSCVGLVRNVKNSDLKIRWLQLKSHKIAKVQKQEFGSVVCFWSGTFKRALPSAKRRTTNTHRESFFSKMPNFWAWADKLGRKGWGHLGYFRPIYQHPFWYF